MKFWPARTTSLAPVESAEGRFTRGRSLGRRIKGAVLIHAVRRFVLRFAISEGGLPSLRWPFSMPADRGPNDSRL